MAKDAGEVPMEVPMVPTALRNGCGDDSKNPVH